MSSDTDSTRRAKPSSTLKQNGKRKKNKYNIKNVKGFGTKEEVSEVQNNEAELRLSGGVQICALRPLGLLQDGWRSALPRPQKP